jgi:hypothetical protein
LIVVVSSEPALEVGTAFEGPVLRELNLWVEKRMKSLVSLFISGGERSVHVLCKRVKEM